MRYNAKVSGHFTGALCQFEFAGNCREQPFTHLFSLDTKNDD